jgi:hypothetical protein
MNRVVALCVLVALAFGLVLPTWAGNHNLPLDRSYTQRNLEPRLLEKEANRLADGDAPLSFIFPRPCISSLDSSRVCSETYRTAYRDSVLDQGIGAYALGAMEFRHTNGLVVAPEAGMLLSGHKGLISFYLDARIFLENAERNWESYDGEEVDVQDADVTGSSSYLSYARYRGELSMDFSFGRLTVGRDAAHWGPSLMGGLVFNQDAVPFHQYTFTTHLGPLTVHSLYGDLRASGAAELSGEKNLYAHRYELRLGRNALLGISEQLLLWEQNKAYLFTPVFPLFMAKSFMHEDSNNGNLAFDLAWRFPGFGLVYGEFLLDDLESPSSLFLKDYSQNKWAALVGIHATRRLAGGWGGAVLEAVRIEPWVYTHFRESPATAANLDRPLGNPLGPNVLDLRCRTYFRGGNFTTWPESGSGDSNRVTRDIGFYLGFTVAATWKGTGPGSYVGDTTYTADIAQNPKDWLKGADSPSLSFEPQASLAWRWTRIEAAWTFTANPRGYFRVLAAY